MKISECGEKAHAHGRGMYFEVTRESYCHAIHH